MTHQTILVLDFGGQYNQLIARRVRETGVYAVVKPYRTPLAEIAAAGYAGIIFTGGPHSVYLDGSPTCDPGIFELGVPVLGICYGAQLMTHLLGGRVESADREYGQTALTVDRDSALFAGLAAEQMCWMSHTDYIEAMPAGFRANASTPHCPCAGMEDAARKLYAVQFHPEVVHTVNGQAMLHNFLYDVCGCVGDWTMEDYAQTAVAAIRETVGDGKVLLALSGGVDSSVLAALLAKAIGRQLTCVFVDHGLMRLHEGDEVEAAFAGWDITLVRVNAEAVFLERLAGLCEPEAKRKAIGEEFIRVFEGESRQIGAVDFLAQGTIYPDVIESGAGDAAVIKSHHNVGGLPDCVDFKEIIEPLRLLFKDEVRALGRVLGLSETLVERQPFPGPGLAIRIIGEVTKAKADMLRAADAIFRGELEAARVAANQYFAVLTDTRSVGVMGDERTYDYTLALRAVTTTDFMTADFCRVPYEVLERVSSRVINEVRGVNRVVYDITTKPPATIEWE